MSKVLYIKASPRVGRSHSVAVADAFIEAYRKANPDDEIQTIDLFTAELPTFDGPKVQAKYSILHGKEPTEEEKADWKSVEAVIEEFKSADKYVFAVPMWNFGIPYRLKQYIDILVQPGYTFSYSPEKGYEGLVTGKPVVSVYARGGDYSPGSPSEAYEMQQRYFDGILGFMGFAEIHAVAVQPTVMEGPDAAKAARKKAIAEAEAIAAKF